MDTKPVALQEQGPVNSPDEPVNDSRVQGEVCANVSQNSPLQDKKAPRAEPEEDIDILEPGAHNETLQDNQTFSKPEIANVTKLESQDSTTNSLDSTGETQEMVTQEVLPPPCPAVTAISEEESLEKADFSDLEGDEVECISNSEIISDPTEDLMCPDSQNSQEQPQSTPLTEPVSKPLDLTTEEMTDDNTTAEESITDLNLSPDGFDNSEAENMPVVAAAGINSTTHNSPSDRNNSDDVYTPRSPPFADESEEEKEVSVDMSCQQQVSKQEEIRSMPLSAKMSVPTSHMAAVTQAKLREMLLSQIQRELALRAANQEAAQQVLSQASPPLLTVVMELSNKGEASSSHGSGCVVAERERHSGAGERTEGESSQIEGEEGQTESGLERNKAVEKQHSGGLFSKAVQTRKPKPKRFRLVSSKHTRMESDSCDDSQSDSGVSADFSPCSTLEGNTIVSAGGPAAAVKETPIEREIRRAIEREHSLRRSRGLPKQPTPEYVEIPLKKTVFFQPLTTNSEKCQGKDRQFAGKKMQHEIHGEVQREQDLVKLGKVPGFYHKGTVRQLKERKRLFEVFQAPTVSTLPLPARTRARSWPFSSEISNMVNQEASIIRGSYIERSPNSAIGGGSTSPALRGPGFSEGTGCQVIIIESNLSVPAENHFHQPKAEASTTVDFGRPNISSYRTGGHCAIKESEQEKEEEEEEELTPKENPFFKLRSSTNLLKVEQDIREAQEREKELLKQRMSLYGGGGGAGARGEGGGGGRAARPSSISGRNPILTRSSSLSRLPVSDSPGLASRPVTGPPAARQSVGKLGMWPPAQAEEGKINRPEFIHSPRKKTPLVQRWEAGLINGHNQEED